MEMLENLEQLLSAIPAKVAKTAKNGSGSTFEPSEAVATEWLTVAKNEPANHEPVETLASLAKRSQNENGPEPAPVLDLSQISHFSQQLKIKENPFCSECIFWPNWTAILAETGQGFWLKLDSFFNRPRGCSH
jgi:hypothetical protein